MKKYISYFLDTVDLSNINQIIKLEGLSSIEILMKATLIPEHQFRKNVFQAYQKLYSNPYLKPLLDYAAKIVAMSNTYQKSPARLRIYVLKSNAGSWKGSYKEVPNICTIHMPEYYWNPPKKPNKKKNTPDEKNNMLKKLFACFLGKKTKNNGSDVNLMLSQQAESYRTMTRKKELGGSLIHEICHMVMKHIFNNFCMPFSESELKLFCQKKKRTGNLKAYLSSIEDDITLINTDRYDHTLDECKKEFGFEYVLWASSRIFTRCRATATVFDMVNKNKPLDKWFMEYHNKTIDNFKLNISKMIELIVGIPEALAVVDETLVKNLAPNLFDFYSKHILEIISEN
ncbi:hypothetical protein ACFLZV_02235 [Candidatus Margulisiibacteriota bacterium]